MVISYYPTEEPDAREVIQLIKAEGRKAIPVPGDLREESYCKELVTKAVAALGGLDVIVSSQQWQCLDSRSIVAALQPLPRRRPNDQVPLSRAHA